MNHRTAQKSVFFDLMDTLVEFREDELVDMEVIAATIESMGIASSATFLGRYRKWRASRSELLPKHKEVDLADRLRIVLDDVKDLELDEIVQSWTDYYLPRTQPKAGIKDMLDAWSSVASMGVVSNFFISGMPEKICRFHGLDGYFDFIIDSAQVGWRKPHIAIFSRAFELAGNEKSETLFVGDNPVADVQGAISAGINPILYSTNTRVDGVKRIENWADFRPNE
jgi:putative hydrolase of the HAD superfamily